MSAQVSVLAPVPTTSVVAGNTARSRMLAILLMALIASIFWVDSRYPALLKRYRAGTQIKATGTLTFGTIYNVDRTMPLSARIYRTTMNWLDANRVGMTFSFLFGPAALTFLGTLRRRRFSSRWLNSLFGAAAGVPLGVCSNCIAPIARGLFASGMSAESVLSTMFSSPALNVVVLAMTFVLFPVAIAATKLATVLFLIFVFAPLASSRDNKVTTMPLSIESPVSERWSEALAGVARSYAKSFWYVFRIAFPWMLLAALLGATVIELLPPQALMAKVTLTGILMVAMVSAFLPVPMAFDVAIAYLARQHGVPIPYVVTILCTLGIVSIYSLSIIGKSISWKVALATYATVVALGTIAGIAVNLMA